MNPPKIIIAISGKKRSGKNTVADYIKEYFASNDFPFERAIKLFAFGDAVKETVAAIVGLPSNHFYNDSSKDEVFTFWTGEKFTGRELLQIIGTKSLRDNFLQSVWISNMNTKLAISNCKIAIVTDLRFKNEYYYLNELANKFEDRVFKIRINKSDLPVDLHRSETELDDFSFDYTIDNNSSLEELKQKTFELCANFVNI